MNNDMADIDKEVCKKPKAVLVEIRCTMYN